MTMYASDKCGRWFHCLCFGLKGNLETVDFVCHCCWALKKEDCKHHSSSSISFFFLVSLSDDPISWNLSKHRASADCIPLGTMPRVRLLIGRPLSRDSQLCWWQEMKLNTKRWACRALVGESVAHLPLKLNKNYCPCWRVVENRINHPKIVLSGIRGFLITASCHGTTPSCLDAMPSIYMHGLRFTVANILFG